LIAKTHPLESLSEDELRRWNRPVILRKASVAPMMDITDRHFRAWMRCLSQEIVLYTEMVTTGALLNGPTDRLLAYAPHEHPLALQLGGSSPQDLARCAQIGEQWGYDEVNLNVGCPSDRVQEGRIGACLMAEPELVRECVQAMLEATKLPVTVKTRLGIDDRDSFEELCEFVQIVASGGCKFFTLHARKAWLKGLSPKQNRDVPPLCYEWVYRFKQEHPQWWIEINGGVKLMSDVEAHLQHVDSVMLGRMTNDNPWELSHFKHLESPSAPKASRVEALLHFGAHVEAELELGQSIKVLIKPLLNLFQGVPGSKKWRQLLSQPKLEGAHLWPLMLDLARELE
jgi:tRNA-dihydrouridine synthase A